MTPLHHWEPCLADSTRGIAFFDGITIETDRLTDPRWDRVLPILEEEQVFMCRMMAPLLKQHSSVRVLDVGTGSGVFAIAAAKLGCHVVAIDVSPRALRFAKQNALRNGIQIATDEPGPGQIRFLPQRFKDLAVEPPFDFIILAPPYNPTCEGFRPALHADAGPLGQRCFEEQLPHAARLLKPNGVCVGNQMMLSHAPGELTTSPAFNAFDANFVGEFSYFRILLKTISVGDFLRGQYASYLKPSLCLIPSHEEVKDYILNTSSDQHFALVYFELTRGHHDALKSRDNSLIVTECVGSTRPPQSWKDRIDLHRRIIEHTSLESSFPAPALFLETDALPIFPKIKTVKEDLSWDNSVLQYINLWLAKTEILDSVEGLFELLLIDTAPWYPTRQGRQGLRQEAAVWTNNPSYNEYLNKYLRNTLSMQAVRVGPFLHKHFTGRNEPSEWRNIQFTVHDQCQDLAQAACQSLNDLVKQLLSQIASADAGKIKAHENQTTISHERDPVLIQYSHSPLNELNIDTNDLSAYDEASDSRIKIIKACYSSLSKNSLIQIDLDLCHEAMHRRLDQLLNGISKTSFLFGIPISTALFDPAEDADESKLPEKYRGGIWIYAVPRNNWSLPSEQFLMDLARLLGVLYGGRYSSLATREAKEEGIVEGQKRDAAMFRNIENDLQELISGMHEISRRAIRIKTEMDYAKRAFLSLHEHLRYLFQDNVSVYYKITEVPDHKLELSHSRFDGGEDDKFYGAHSATSIKVETWKHLQKVIIAAAVAYKQEIWLSSIGLLLSQGSKRESAFNFLKILIHRPHMERDRLYEHQVCFAIRLATAQKGMIDVIYNTVKFNINDNKMNIDMWLSNTAPLYRKTKKIIDPDNSFTAIISSGTSCATLLGALMQLVGQELSPQPDVSGRVAIESATINSTDEYLEVMMTCAGTLPSDAFLLNDQSAERGLRSCLLTLCRAANQLQPAKLQNPSKNAPAFEVVVKDAVTTLILRLPRAAS